MPEIASTKFCITLDKVMSLPGQVLNVSITPGDTEISISWDEPTLGGVPESYSVVVASVYTGIATNRTVSYPATDTVVAGLTNGWPYTVYVYATNASGDGPSSTVSSQVIPSQNVPTPDQPTITYVEAGNSKIRVDWTSAYTGGTPTGFIISAVPSSGTSIVTPVGANFNSAIVTGVQNETAYKMYIIAINAGGPSIQSTESQEITPSASITVPDPVTDVNATSASTRINIQWSAPSSGSPVSTYSVTVTPMSGGSPTTTTVSSNITSTYILGLQNGTTYSVSVVATNIEGDSSVVYAPLQVTPSAPIPPEPPTNVQATPGDGLINVSWVHAATGTTPTLYFVLAINTSRSTPPLYVQVGYPEQSGTITGLINGDTYNVQVYAAVSGVSSSERVTVYDIVPQLSLPGKVTTVSAIPGTSQAIVSWTDNLTGGIPTSYTVNAIPKPSGNTVSTNVIYPNNSALLINLLNGITYDIQVIAENASGSSPASDSVEITPQDTPNPLQSISIAAVGDGSVTLSWVPDTGGGVIESYLVYVPGFVNSPFTVNAPTTQYMITGLTNGTLYTHYVFIIASNALFQSQPVFAPDFTPVAPVQVPGQVTDVILTPRNASVIVSWTAPENGGVPETYLITATPVSGSVVTKNVNYPITSTTVNGLTNNMSYTFVVQGVNEGGTGQASEGVSTIPKDVPAPVSSVSVVSVGSSFVTLSWVPNTTAGIIEGYTITAYMVDDSPFTFDASTTQATITGLVSNTTYINNVNVIATNSIYNSTAVRAPSFTTLIQVFPPGQPIGVSATPGNASADIGWTEPVSGGTPDKYIITITDEQNNTSTTEVNWPAVYTTITNLINGVSYTFTVTANNSAGNGPESASSIPITPLAPPKPVQSIAVDSVDETAVSFSWTPDTSGGPIDSYRLYAPNISGSPFTIYSPTTEATITGLRSGTTYTHYFYIIVVNSIGVSSSVFAPTFKTLSLPGDLISLSASPGNATASLSWVDPLVGGTPTYYAILATSASGTNVSKNVNFPATSTIVSGLTNGASYTFTITAVNTVGSSATISTENAITPQLPPNRVLSVSIVTVGDGSVTLSWVPDRTGGPIDNYIVTLNGQVGSPYIVNEPNTQLIIMGLVNGTTYSGVLSVEASNYIGNSAKVYAPDFTPIPPPTQVQNFTVSAGDTQAVTSWSSPESGGTPVTYTITATPSNGVDSPVVFTVNYPDTSFTCNGLTNLLTYIFQIIATNAAGSSPPSTATTIRIGLAGPVRNVSATGGDAKATVYWSFPVTGGTPSYYMINAIPYSGNTVIVRTNYPATRTSITGLINGMTYVITVASFNAAGSSSLATSANTVTPVGANNTGGGGDPHIVTIYGEHYMLPNELKFVSLLEAIDKHDRKYSVTATMRFLSLEELEQKKAFCISRVLNRHNGFIRVKEVKTLDKDTIAKLAAQSCFDSFTIEYENNKVVVDGFSGEIVESIVDDEIRITETDELMRTSTGSTYYPRTPQLKSFDIVFGFVIVHISVDDTYADINYIRFDMNQGNFKNFSGAIIKRVRS
jgi:large repetitive protein